MAQLAMLDLDDAGIRRAVNEFSVSKAEGPHKDFIARLAARWHEFNEEHFEGRLSPAYIAVSEPRSPRAEGDCSPFSGHGGRLQIRIRPSHVAGTANQGKKPAPGRTVRYMRPGHDIRYRERWVADILLHEMGHQFEMEVLGTKGGHGRDFCDICNQIGESLGLAPVVVRRRKGDPKTLPICAEWPSNVRPKDYYGDLWAEITAPTEEDEDPVLALVARFAALEEPGQIRFLTHPVLATAYRVILPEPATTNGGMSDADRLCAAMELHDWTQGRLAKAAGTSQTNVSRIVNGKRVGAEIVARVLAAAEGSPT